MIVLFFLCFDWEIWVSAASSVSIFYWLSVGLVYDKISRVGSVLCVVVMLPMLIIWVKSGSIGFHSVGEVHWRCLFWSGRQQRLLGHSSIQFVAWSTESGPRNMWWLGCPRCWFVGVGGPHWDCLVSSIVGN